MHANHQPTPFCGPVPDGLMRVTLDLPKHVFQELEELVDAALLFAASHR